MPAWDTVGCKRPPATVVVLASGDGHVIEACLASLRAALRRDDHHVVVDLTDGATVDPFAFAPARMAASLDDALALASDPVVIVLDEPAVVDPAWLDDTILQAGDPAGGRIVVHGPVPPPPEPARERRRDLRGAVRSAAQGPDPLVAMADTARALVVEGRALTALNWLAWMRIRRGDDTGLLLELAARANLGDRRALLELAAPLGPHHAVLLADGLGTQMDDAEVAAEDYVFPSVWPALVEHAAATGHDIRGVLGAIPAERLVRILARLQFASAEAMDAAAEALWALRPRDRSVAAFAAWAGPRLALDRALTWSGRLREVDLDDECPLVAIATDPARPGPERVRAAVCAVGAFDDARAAEALPDAVSAVGDDDLVGVVVDTFEIVPDALDMVLVAAATTRSRCTLLAECLRANGAPDGADALASHAETLVA